MAETQTISKLDIHKKGSTPSVLQTSFNYYAPSTPPQLNDLSILSGSSPDLTSHAGIPVTDLRSLPPPITIYNHETHGFQILEQPLPIDSSHESVHDPKVMTTQYYPAIISLLKEKFGIRSGVVINHTLRDVKDFSNFDPKKPHLQGLAPFFIAHSDYTAAGVRAHLWAMTPKWLEESDTVEGTTEEERELFLRLRDEIATAEDAAMVKAGIEPGDGDFTTGRGGHWEWDGRDYDGSRYGIFSIWRPWETVHRDPLAVLDTLGNDFEFMKLPRSYHNRKGYVKEYYTENVLVRPPTPGDEAKQKWYYLSEQKPEEVYAIKLYDSEALRRGDGSVRLMCPHSAFQMEDMKDMPARRSCELRVWCIW